MSRFRLFIEWFAILACALGMVWWAQSAGLTARLDDQVLDFATSRAAAPASDDVLLATIDDRSLAEGGKWPWDRRDVARMVDNLTAAGAKLVVLDILFVEPSNPGSDAALGASLAASKRVALPYAFTPARDRSSGVDLLEPIPELSASAAAMGHVGLNPDKDDVMRRMALRMRDGDNVWPHLAVASYRFVNGRDPAVLSQPDDAPVVPLRPAGAFRTIPAISVLRGEIPPGFVKDKVVIVGATAPGLGDSYQVSSYAGSIMSGAELQANLYQTLGDNSFILPLGQRESTLLAVSAVLLLFVGFWRLRPAYCLVLAIILTFGLLSLSLYLVGARHLWFAPGPGMAALILAYPLWGWRRLAAVSGFLEAEAGKLQPASSRAGVASLGGFDSVAKQVSRLEFLVDEVSERRAFLVRVVEATPDAMCVFAPDGGLLLMNARARALFGPETAGLQLADLILSVRGRFDAEGTEMTLDDGRSFAVTNSVGEEDGEWNGIRIYVFTDISDIRRAEADRRQMLEFLSHDMRSPQVAILGLAAERAGQPEPADRFERIRGHAKRTMKLADDFVQLARLAEAPLSLAEADLAALADEALDRAWSLARDKEMTLKRDLPEDGVLLHCDADLLSRVLDNLIGNALKYGESGGTVTVTVRNEAGDEGIMAVVSVADTGPGLPPERVADPFKRFGARGNTTQPGTGLGLAFVQAAIDRHHGRIECETAEGIGTRFTVFLPGLPPEHDSEV